MTENKRKVPSQATSVVAYQALPPEADDPLLAFAPYCHVAPRRNSITPERQRAFIAHLAATGIVKQAALHIGASLEAVYKLRHRPGAEGFSAAWDEALDRGVARLEDCALARAIAGEERMVVSAGKLLGTEVRHNEALVMFFLRNRRGGRHGHPQEAVRAGHPLYEAIRAELEAGFAARLAEREAEWTAADRERETEWERTMSEVEQDRVDWEEEQDRIAAEAEAKRTPEERQRHGLLEALQRWSLDDLLRKVSW